MLVSKIDYNMLSEVVKLKEVVRGSVEAVMDEKITASHLATDVYALLDLLDKLENEWKGTPPEDDVAIAAQAPPVETPPAEEAKPEAPPAEQAPAEQPPAEGEAS